MPDSRPGTPVPAPWSLPVVPRGGAYTVLPGLTASTAEDGAELCKFRYTADAVKHGALGYTCDPHAVAVLISQRVGHLVDWCRESSPDDWRTAGAGRAS